MKISAADAIREVKKKYAGMDASTRAYVGVRCALGNYNMLIPHLPDSGNVLDYGCGMGQLSIIAAMAGDCRVWGYDISEDRLKAARAAAKGMGNASFCGSESELPDIQWSCVIFFDTLHYVSPVEQDGTVLKYANKTAPGGVLLIRDVSKVAGARFAATKIHEAVMVTSGLTPTREKTTHMRNIREFVPLLEKAGFSVKIHQPLLLHPYADYLLVAKKTRDAGGAE